MGNGYDFVVKNGMIVYPEKLIFGDLGIAEGKIAAVGTPGSLGGVRTIDAAGRYVLPGVIDPHAHPVYLDSIADTARTAAWGGVTTIVHYAYAKPGESLAAVIRAWKADGSATSCIDFALHGGLFDTMKQAEEIPEAFSLGVTSFKMFMAYAKLGWMTDDYALCKGMDAIGKLGGLACIHAETGLAIDYIQDRMLAEKADFAERFPETSPDIAEAEGLFRCVSIGRLMNCPVYIPHVSSREAVEVLRFFRSKGVRVFAETCPQYLSLTWDELKSKGALGKVGPSIKTKDDQDALWAGIREGLFDCFGSDHAPKDKKIGDDFFKAAYGSPQAETMLPVIWTEGVNTGRLAAGDIARLFAENPAKILGLYPRKGRLEIGSDADVVVFDPAEAWTVRHGNQHSKATYTLYEGKELLGRVKTVLSRGEPLILEGEYVGGSAVGRFLPTRAGSSAHGGLTEPKG